MIAPPQRAAAPWVPSSSLTPSPDVQRLNLRFLDEPPLPRAHPRSTTSFPPFLQRPLSESFKDLSHADRPSPRRVPLLLSKIGISRPRLRTSNTRKESFFFLNKLSLNRPSGSLIRMRLFFFSAFRDQRAAFRRNPPSPRICVSSPPLSSPPIRSILDFYQVACSMDLDLRPHPMSLKRNELNLTTGFSISYFLPFLIIFSS